MAMSRGATFTAVAALLIAACTTIRPGPGAVELPEGSFSHGRWDRVLQQHVDSAGRVDYAGLAANPRELDAYFEQIAGFSPDSHPHLFRDRDARLAYWINAYNASVIKAVVEAYPISSVGDVGFGFWKIGFFVQQKIVVGGTSMSLYYLENSIVRERFRDARIHFALNCASASCPTLPNRAFQAATLQERLDQEARRFVAATRNVRVDHDRRVIYLSSIFDWYESDFTDWPTPGLPRHPSLLDYISHYAEAELQADLARAGRYDIRFDTYDWSLNDQAAVK